MGRNAHAIGLAVLTELAQPGLELVVPVLFEIALRRHLRQLSLLIHMQFSLSHQSLLLDGRFRRMGINRLPCDGVGKPDGREPGRFQQVALQLALSISGPRARESVIRDQSWTRSSPESPEKPSLTETEKNGNG